MSTSLHDLRGAVRAARKRLMRNRAEPRTYDLFRAYVAALGRYQRQCEDREHPEASAVSVAAWVSWDEAERLPEAPNTTWHHAALISEIRARGLKFGGFAHQSSDLECVPVFSDGGAWPCSMREWGALMAEAHGESGPYAYAQYAWILRDKGAEVLP